jgi:uncharacterized protein YbjT (DUF2867 family)
MASALYVRAVNSSSLASLIYSMKVIITGATGMVGEGVLHYCLQDARVEKVLVLSRKSCGVTHPKMEELLHADFFNVQPIAEQLKGYDACYFCLGVSSVGMDADAYYRFTYTLTMHIAGVLAPLNPEMTFCYVSGAGTDSTEKGRSRWARVKGKTENDLLKLFKNAYMFRPAYLLPVKGMKFTHKLSSVFAPVYPLFKAFFPKFMGSIKELALAMLHVTERGYEKRVLEVGDMRKASS